MAAAAVSVVLLFGSATAKAPNHLRGCNSARCDRVARHSCSVDPACIKRVQVKRWHRTADPFWGIFQAISECESHGNWATNTGNGYFGGVQFSLTSWRSVGGRDLPSQASKLEQIYRAVLLMRRQGYGAWPVCRRAAGV